MIVKDERGVTLIELLAVISLITVILLAVTSAQLNWFGNTTKLPQQTLNQERLRFAFEQIVKDIEEADIVSCNPSDGIQQTLSLNITKDASAVIYQYDTDTNVLSVLKQGNNIVLAENVISFIIKLENDTYYIEGKIEDIDLKTNLPYRLVTSAKPIIW